MRNWFFGVICFLSPAANAQKMVRTTLLLSSTHYAVAREMAMDLDSSLILAGRYLQMSRLAVIVDGFPDSSWAYSNRWVDMRTPFEALQVLPTLQGATHLRQMVLLGAYYAFQPNAYIKYKDSVLYFLSRAEDESKRLHDVQWHRQILCLLGKVWADGRQEIGGQYFQRCIDECHQAGDAHNEAKAWFYRGFYTPYSPASSRERIGYFEKAAALYDSLRLPADEANCLVDLGYMYVTTLELKKSEGSFRKALGLQEAAGFPYTEYTTDDLAMILVDEGKYGEPLKYSIQTVNTAEKLKDSLDYGTFYERLGSLYAFQDAKFQAGMDMLSKAIDAFPVTDPDPPVYRVYDLLVNNGYYDGHEEEALAKIRAIAASHPPSSLMNRMDYCLALQTCYIVLKRFSLADKVMKEATQLEKQLEALRGNYNQSTIYGRRGILLFQEGNYTSARRWLQRSLDAPSSVVMTPKSRLIMLKYLFNTDSALGNFPEAFHYMRSFTHVLDSSLNLQMGRQAEELAVRYETEQKESEIKLQDQRIRMLQQADLLRQTRLRQAELVRNITFGGILIAAVIIGLLYRLYRQKKKNARVITSKNELLENLLVQKEWLLKEVHHRVKNNLHTIFCLLESQAKYLEDDALEAVADSQHRIYAMSLLHQKIYQTEDSRTVDMAIYLREFVRYLRESFGTPAHIHLFPDIQALQFGVTQAIPVALIVNEAVTNAIKHAFPDGREGEIYIRLKQEGLLARLTIADNGVGMDHGLVVRDERSFGLSLIEGLARELGGKLDFENHIGTTINLTFTPV